MEKNLMHKDKTKSAFKNKLDNNFYQFNIF